MKSRYVLASLTTLWLSGCGNAGSHLPTGEPLIGELSIMSEENQPNYSATLPVCNRGPETLTATISVKAAKDEILIPIISELSAPSGVRCLNTLFDIKKKRTKPIWVKVVWQCGQERGVKRFLIAPQQKSDVYLSADSPE